MVFQRFAEGKAVYRRLGYEGATKLVDTVSDRIGSNWEGGTRGVPANNAQKRQLVDALLQSIAEEQAHSPSPPPAAQTPAPTPATPQPDRKLVFDTVYQGSVQSIVKVYYGSNGRGELGFAPFIQYFAVPATVTASIPKHLETPPIKHPIWEESHRHRWIKRQDVAFEVCRQAPGFLKQVNARAAAFGRAEHQTIQQITLDAAVHRVAALMQNAINANASKKRDPASVTTLSAVYKQLRGGEQRIVVKRASGGVPTVKMPADALQAWLHVASNGDVDALVNELYSKK